MLKITKDSSCHYPFAIVDEDGDHMNCTRDDLIDLRDQLNVMFPPEPVEAPAKVEAVAKTVYAKSARIFTDTKDGTTQPFRVKDLEGPREIWLDEGDVARLYAELQAHFGNNQNSTNPDQVDTSIDWARERWEVAKLCMPTRVIGDKPTSADAEIAICAADSLIARYRAEPKRGGGA